MENNNRLISLLSDYGFKITFANEKNQVFLRKAIQLLMDSTVEIKSVKHLPTEFEGMVEDSRKGFYDTVCKTDKGTFVIIEMQVGNYQYLLERLLFYTSQLYITQINKGKKGFAKVEPVYCICIVKDAILENSEEFYHKSTFRTENGFVLMDKMQLILVELEKFTKLADEINNELEELLFTMKNAHNIDISNHMNIPHFWKKEWLQGVLSELNLSTMSPLNRALFNISVARHMAINDEWERETKAIERKVKRKVTREVTKEVTKEVTTGIKTATAKKLLLAGKLSPEEIAETLEVELSFVLNIQKEIEESKNT